MPDIFILVIYAKILAHVCDHIQQFYGHSRTLHIDIEIVFTGKALFHC